MKDNQKSKIEAPSTSGTILCIGLFGACGGSRWRDSFVESYTNNGIPYYNPQRQKWKTEGAVLESYHLAKDEIVLFPVTGETYGLGSLSEFGFKILNAIRTDARRDFIVYIEPDLNAELDGTPLAEESRRMRALVMRHLLELRLSNLYIVDSLDEMLAVSLKLFESSKIRHPLRVLNPHNLSR